MEAMILTNVFDLIELLQAVFGARLSTDVAPGALRELERLQTRVREHDDLIDCTLEIVALAYKHQISGKPLEIAIPLHEGVYNTIIRASIPHLEVLSQFDLPGVVALLRQLVPDQQILLAMLNRLPLYVTLGESVRGHLRYLHRRGPALRNLLERLQGERDKLRIANSESFEKLLASIEKLATVCELIQVK